MLASPSQLLLAGNSLLNALEDRDLRLMLPHVSRVSVQRGELIYAAGAPIDWIYFPETAIVAFAQQDVNGRSIETGLVGREGFLGWSALMGRRGSMGRAVVQLDGGTLLRVAADEIKSACEASPALSRVLMQFVESIMAQMGCSMLANSIYPLSSRLARWLLMRHDRLSTNEVHAYHDDISVGLGVRRASVTDCLHVLEGEHLVRSRRGKIIICDRPGLESLAGGCYESSADHQHGRTVGRTYAAPPAPSFVADHGALRHHIML